jgi:hypothetical protein
MGTVTADVLRDAARGNPELTDVVETVASLRARQMDLLRHALSATDISPKENWSVIVALAMEAGATEAKILLEVGASPTTIHRWLKRGVAPREGTRSLIKGALLAIVDEIRETGKGACR